MNETYWQVNTVEPPTTNTNDEPRSVISTHGTTWWPAAVGILILPFLTKNGSKHDHRKFQRTYTPELLFACFHAFL